VTRHFSGFVSEGKRVYADSRFIIDTHLPPNLAHWLARRGLDATHPYFLPFGERMTDEEIRRVAVNEDRIIVTKDSDFFEHYLLKGTPPRVLLSEYSAYLST